MRYIYEAVIIRLESDLHRMLQWFNDNGMKANPSEFQVMFLGQKDMSKLRLNINGLLIPSTKQVKLLWVNIDNLLKFEARIKELCRKVSQTVHAFGRLRPFFGEQESKLLFNSMVVSTFSYCPLIWLFCSKQANNGINRTQKRTQEPDLETMNLRLKSFWIRTSQ